MIQAILKNYSDLQYHAFVEILGNQACKYIFYPEWKFRNFHFDKEAQIEI